jgi:hypothetical protein
MIVIIFWKSINNEALNYVTSSPSGSNKPLTTTKHNCSSEAHVLF